MVKTNSKNIYIQVRNNHLHRLLRSSEMGTLACERASAPSLIKYLSVAQCIYILVSFKTHVVSQQSTLTLIKKQYYCRKSWPPFARELCNANIIVSPNHDI